MTASDFLMKVDEVELYVSAATNRFHRCAAIDPSSGTVVFGSHKLVAIWQLEDKSKAGIKHTLTGHDALVTCVEWINSETVMSGDEQGHLIVWRKSQLDTWQMIRKHKSHPQPVAALAVYGSLLVSAASDSNVKLWSWKDDRLQLLQTIGLARIPLDIVLAPLPVSKHCVLVISTTSPIIEVWVQEEEMFVKKVTLSGHEDWVRCLAITRFPRVKDPEADEGKLMLASGSHDGSIRLWRIEPGQSSSRVGEVQNAEFLENLADESDISTYSSAEVVSKKIGFQCHAADSSLQAYSIILDALLVGHEAGITFLQWNPSSIESNLPGLLSTSTDSSLILWSTMSMKRAVFESTDQDSLWVVHQRFGDVGGQRLGGFVGGGWANGGYEALAYCWNGGWRRWRKEGSPEPNNVSSNWKEIEGLTGHQGPVKGLSWEQRGEYLLSASSDQTSRIHSPTYSDDGRGWREVGRPQIHGYDLVDIASIDHLRFASIADEKVIRVFEAPQSFVSTMKEFGAFQHVDEKVQPAGARLPPLGLSNKATEEGLKVDQEGDFDYSYRLLEGELSANSLWPERDKIFGHGYESIALACSNSGKIIATACKATTPEHAVIRLDDLTTCQSFQEPITGHSLTITRLSWSSDDKHILSVSRDRTWRISSLDEGQGVYLPITHGSVHTRVIWDCAWLPGTHCFATAARDRTVHVWLPDERRIKWHKKKTLDFDHAATAVDFANPLPDGRVPLAVGLESGVVLLHLAMDQTFSSWEVPHKIDMRYCCADAVLRLAWRPSHRESRCRDLAIGSEDRSLRVLRFTFEP